MKTAKDDEEGTVVALVVAVKEIKSSFSKSLFPSGMLALVIWNKSKERVTCA